MHCIVITASTLVHGIQRIWLVAAWLQDRNGMAEEHGAANWLKSWQPGSRKRKRGAGTRINFSGSCPC